ncbi:MAG: murein biosynthesis integral membrane protein MurJ [Candidatus Cloacimonas sp.]
MGNKSLAKNIGSMSIAVTISRVFGLIRDMMIAGYFGASYVADAFQVGYQIPNLLRKLFGEGALSAAFIPIYNEIEVKQGRKEQIDFALNIFSLLTLLLTFLTAIGMIFAPLIVRLLAPGFEEASYALTVKLTRIMFPYLFLIGLSSTFISILNSHNYFFIPGLSSALLNVGMILFLGLFSLLYQSTIEEKAIALSYGMIFGGVLQTIINLPLLKRIGYNLRVNLNLKGRALTELWRRFIPGVIGMAIREINLAADLIIASFLISGSIAALQYGNRLMQLPLGIIGVSTSSAVLPLFSRYTATKEWDKLSESLRFSVVTTSYLMIPISFLIIGLGKDIIRLLFMRGAFDAYALDMTYKALVCYSLGLVFYSLTRTIIPLFYANKDTRTPVKISAIIVATNIILNIILMQFLQHSGLALATSISSLLHYIILIKVIRRKIPQISLSKIAHNIVKILIISSLLLTFILLTNQYFTAESILQLIAKLTTYFVFSALFYYGGTYLLKVEYIAQFTDSIWKRLKIR